MHCYIWHVIIFQILASSVKSDCLFLRVGKVWVISLTLTLTLTLTLPLTLTVGRYINCKCLQSFSPKKSITYSCDRLQLWPLTVVTTYTFDTYTWKTYTKGRGQKKKCSKSMVFYQTRGGVSEGNKKPNPFFGKVFFQWACRIILGPPKHVLQLVWSAYVLSTAIRTALKVAWGTRILGKRRPLL